MYLGVSCQDLPTPAPKNEGTVIEHEGQQVEPWVAAPDVGPGSPPVQIEAGNQEDQKSQGKDERHQGLDRKEPPPQRYLPVPV